MKLEVVNSQNLNDTQKTLADMDSEAIRGKVLQSARDFKDSWRNLAQALQFVWKDKLYKDWGYETFDQYTAREIKVRKHTAMKLISSYSFLEKEAPRYLLENDSASSKDVQIAPSYEAVAALQRAKKNLDESDYENIKKEIFEEGKDAGQVKKDLTALILKRRKEVDPENERIKENRIAINRFLGVLRAFRRDIGMLKLLPGHISKDIDSLIAKIEKEAEGSCKL
ncbi:MAG: hypothetical protein PHU64_06135 [Candidatus Omnitrophica bacterium]|nr:hypothetical protein [Candidatus Omnitrophota bacterium]MDD5429515.1 hypothetical protein [Candidatus Omnitrophota bacterium]